MPEAPATLGFWGVRGSTPTVDRANWRYGGNTPCLELVAPDKTRFILDCGTGLRTLGNRRVSTPMDAHVFVTHYHWDHIQGIPFFAPLYSAQHSFHFYSFRSEHLGRQSLKRVLEAQMAQPYFPVDVNAMAARREFSEIDGGDTIQIGSTRITAKWLNHPQGCLGFRFDTSAGTIVYATDNEPGNKVLDKNIRELAAGSDIFINDAQYTPEQLAGPRKGWGHSTWQEGVAIARETGAKNLVLFHHDPDSTDQIVDSRLHEARQQFGSVWAATEGMVMRLEQRKLVVALKGARAGQRRDSHFSATVVGRGEDGREFREKTVIHSLTLYGVSVNLKRAPQLQSQVKMVIETPPDASGNTQMELVGHVVHCEPGKDGTTAVGIIFAEEPNPD